MIARRSVWSNPEVSELLKQFVVAADEVHRLQTGKDPECRLAQKVFEQGHYAGRTRPTNTRQGTYATAPSGVMLASINSNDPKQMAAMLRRALGKWNAMSEAERMLAGDPTQKQAEVRRHEDRYPADGLVLRVFSRDLPREKKTEGWRENAWNQDYAWFRKEEVRTMLPGKLEPGQKAAVPAAVLNRLVRFNFVDNVRGQTAPYDAKDILVSKLDIEIVSVSDGIATLKLTGETKTEREGAWSIAGFQDMNSPSPQRRGMDLKLYGTAKFDTAKRQFTDLQMLALGKRIGATQYNGRHDDPGPAPIGFYITKAGNKPSEKVAPSFFWSYGWN